MDREPNGEDLSAADHLTDPATGPAEHAHIAAVRAAAHAASLTTEPSTYEAEISCARL